MRTLGARRPRQTRTISFWAPHASAPSKGRSAAQLFRRGARCCRAAPPARPGPPRAATRALCPSVVPAAPSRPSRPARLDPTGGLSGLRLRVSVVRSWPSSSANAPTGSELSRSKLEKIRMPDVSHTGFSAPSYRRATPRAAREPRRQTQGGVDFSGGGIFHVHFAAIGCNYTYCDSLFALTIPGLLSVNQGVRRKRRLNR